ncbi:POP1-domain-containing protein [Trametopsis cervina]|nr:POP1-domain-containing protein [Trametopsis cervina]
MSGKRKMSGVEMSGRDKKKQKTSLARTIAVQPLASGSGSAAAGPSKSVQFENAPPLPGSLDVERFAEARAFEINAMHTAMQNARADTTHRAWQQLPRHLRRRAASHDVRRVPKRLRDKAKAEMDAPKVKPKKHIPQRGKAKRVPRMETLLKRQRDKWWLESHLWHAKRMHMENMWGYRLAVTPTEKSFRPSHRASVHGSILHDASYYGLIEIKGPEAVIRSIMDRCCDCQGPSPASKRFTTGARACDTHLYKPGSYPLELLGPARVLWRGLDSSSGEPGTSDTNLPSKGDGKGKEKANTSQKSDSKRTVWVWVHPSIFDIAFLALERSVSFALESVKKSNPPPKDTVDVDIADLRNEVNVFEIMGPKASQIIHGALKPVPTENRDGFKKCWASLADLQSSASVPRNTVIGFKVQDPRLSYPPKNAKVATDTSSLPSLSSSASSFFPTSTLAQSEIWDDNIRKPLLKPRYKKSDIDRRRSQNLVPGYILKEERRDDRIPVLLIQRSVENVASQAPHSAFSSTPSIHGWTLIIPAGWSMAFLPSLIHTGTRVGGQRERQTQAFESSSPFFPRDYPGTPAYHKFVVERACKEADRWGKKPKAKRPNWNKLGIENPWYPEWDALLGLREPEPFQGGNDEQPEFVDAQRVYPSAGQQEQGDNGGNEGDDGMEVDASSAASEMEYVAAGEGDNAEAGGDSLHIWLLRGEGVTTLLSSLAASATPTSRVNTLLQHVNTLRSKRDLSLLPVQHQTMFEPFVSSHELYRGALVRVCVRMIGRGCPSDMAVIYGMEDDELIKIKQATARPKPAEKFETDSEDNVPQTTLPPHTAIVGYVSTGSFSLSLGEGSAVAAVSLAKLVELFAQSKRHGLSAVTVKVRDSYEVFWRLAHLLVMED